MVMEILPLGPLDVYLADPKNRVSLKEGTLVEASSYLANALYSLVSLIVIIICLKRINILPVIHRF